MGTATIRNAAPIARWISVRSEAAPRNLFPATKYKHPRSIDVSANSPLWYPNNRQSSKKYVAAFIKARRRAAREIACWRYTKGAIAKIKKNTVTDVRATENWSVE